MDIICYSCGRGEKPENTIEGIRHCQKVNPNWRIEMDIQLTLDDHLVLFHDYNTMRVTGVNKLINQLTLKHINDLNAGYNFSIVDEYEYRTNPVKIPKLEQVFKEFPKSKLLLDIHSNDPKVVQVFIDLIDAKFKYGDFIVVSEYDEIIHKLREKKPNWKYGVPAMEAKKMVYSSFIYLDNLFPIKADILMLPKKYGNINVLNKRVINHAKRRGKEIWAWLYEGEDVKTATSLSDYNKLKEMGVDAVFSDSPELLLKELKNSGDANY